MGVKLLELGDAGKIAATVTIPALLLVAVKRRIAFR